MPTARMPFACYFEPVEFSYDAETMPGLCLCRRPNSSLRLQCLESVLFVLIVSRGHSIKSRPKSSTGAATVGRHVDSSYLLLQSHDLESLKVGQVLPSLGLLCLLSPRRLGPLLVDLLLLPHLLDGTSTGSFRDGDHPWGQSDCAGVKCLSGNDCVLFR